MNKFSFSIRNGIVGLLMLTLLLSGLAFSATAEDHNDGPEIPASMQPMPEAGTAVGEAKLDILTGWVAGTGRKTRQQILDTAKKLWDFEVSIEEGTSGQLPQVVASRVAGGRSVSLVRIPPTSETQSLASQGVFMDVTDIWEDYGLEEVIPNSLQSLYKANGNYYGFPQVIEDHSMLFYNVEVLEEAGADLPPYEDYDKFFSVLEKVRENTDSTPIVLGVKEPNAARWLFGKLIVGAVGPAGYAKIANGNATVEDWTEVLEQAKELLSYANKDVSTLKSGFGPQQRTATGDAAFTNGGTWFVPIFNEAGERGEVWNYAPMPGPGRNTLYAMVSSYWIGATSDQPNNSKAVVYTSLLPQVQKEMALVKQAAPARTDVQVPEEDASAGTLYQINQLKTADAVVPTFDLIIPSGLGTQFEDALMKFVSNRNVEKTAKELVRIQNNNEDKYTGGYSF